MTLALRRRSWPLGLLLLILLLAVTVGPLASPGAASTSSSGCGCAGDYVNPKVSAGRAPVDPAETSGTYQLSISVGSVVVTDKKTGRQVLNQQLSGDFHAGFDPSGTKLAIWAPGFVRLYDLASGSQSPLWGSTADGAAAPSGLGFSGGGKYFLYVAQASSQFAKLWVVDTTTGTEALDEQVPVGSAWTFSPDEDRLLITTATGTLAQQELYDLAARRVTWSGSGASGSQGAFFSPHGEYFGVATITAGNHVALTILRAASGGTGQNKPVTTAGFTAAGPPGQGKDNFGYVGWGFSPDKADGTFVYSAADGAGGVTLSMQNLADGSAAATFPYPGIRAGFWQFSPCGDYLAIAVQDGGSSLSLGLFPTSYNSSPTAVASDEYGSLNVSLKATTAWQVATVDGVDHDLVGNTGCQGAPGGGTGNGSPSSPGAPGNGSGSGTPGGGGGGIPGGGNIPGGVFLPASITGFTLDQAVVSPGQSLTGTLTLNSGAGTTVSLVSSDPDALTVPASTWVSHPGSGTFTAQVGSVTEDEIVTITATASGGSKTAQVAVTAGCTAAPAGLLAPAARPIGDGPGPVPEPRTHNWQWISSFSVDPLILTGGESSSGTVTLSAAAKQDTTVSLTSGDTAAVAVTSSVVIPQGQTSATFPVVTHPVSEAGFVSLAAAVGNVKRWAEVVVLPAPRLASVEFQPSRVTAGSAATGTVSLSAPIPGCVGDAVQLQSSNPQVAAVPAAVVVPPGASSVEFPVTTQSVQAATDVTVTATSGDGAAQGVLTVAPATPQAPDNDNFADARVLGIPTTVEGDTGQATIEPAEQVLSGTCYVLPNHQLLNSVWFKVTPEQTGTLTVSTANQGTNFDTVLALYDDPGTTDIADLGTPVACDNNGDPDDSGHHTSPDGQVTPTWSSIMSADVEAGKTYYLQLGGVGGAPKGHYVLTSALQ